MDKKRKRYLTKQRKRSASGSTQELGPCSCGCGGEGVIVPPDELFDFFEAHRTPEDIANMEECQAAQARGDARSALDAYRRGLHIPGGPQEAMLKGLAMFGRATPPWLLARWIASQAYGWMLLREDPRTDLAVRLTMVSCYEVPDEWHGRQFIEFGTSIGACDWVAQQLATYDFGGLADFLDVVIDDEFRDRVPMIGEWADAPLQPFRYESADERLVHISQVNTGERFEVVNRGCLEGSALGAFVLGRIVPATSGGPLIFATRPLEIDEWTARHLSESEDNEEFPGWLIALASAFHEGRIGEGIGGRTADVLLDSPFDFQNA